MAPPSLEVPRGAGPRSPESSPPGDEAARVATASDTGPCHCAVTWRRRLRLVHVCARIREKRLVSSSRLPFARPGLESASLACYILLTMESWTRQTVLAIAILAVLFSTVGVAVHAFCSDDEAPECCAYCACCPHAPPVVSDGAASSEISLSIFPLAMSAVTGVPPVEPRKILHVPKSSLPARS